MDTKATITTYVNGEEARKALEELKKTAKGLRGEISKAYEIKDIKGARKLEGQLKGIERQMRDARKEGYNIAETMKRLNEASPKELRDTLRSINTQMNNGTVKRGTKEWNEYKDMAKKVRQELASINREQKESESWLSRVGGKFKSFFSSMVVQLSALVGASWGARESISTYLSLDESYSDPMKYAGMTKEAVKEMNEDFKKIDTRTAREELNRLAGAAGRLGIKGKEDLLEFVDAADVVYLALGEDLGEDGVANIGKMAQMFGEDEKKGLRGAMLATASAVNELAQASSATEGYLVGFSAQIGGVANTANMAQTDVLGFASVLDQNMQKQEKSATALQNVINKMFQKPKEFADAMGVSVKEFTTLLSEDTNEALLQFFEALNKKGGLEEISPLLDKMSLSGSGASSVISTLANKVDDIRVAQEIAKKAYQEGNSVIDEANLKNNTAQAILEKKQKALKDEAEVLGEILFPLQTSGLGLLTQTIKVTGSVITFAKDHAKTLIALGATIAAYTVATKLNVLWQERKNKASLKSIALDKIEAAWTKTKTAASLLYTAVQQTMTGNTAKATEAWKKFNLVVKANPIGLVTGLVVALASGIYLLATRLSAAEKAQRSLNKIQKEAQSSIDGERSKLMALYEIASDENQAKEKRLEAIKRINEISPEYLGNLDLETIKTGKAKEAIEDYVKARIRSAELSSAESRISEIETERRKVEDRMNDTSFWGNTKKFFRSSYYSAVTLGLVESNKEILENLEVEKKELEKYMKDKLSEDVSIPKPTATPTGDGGDSDPKKPTDTTTPEDRLKKQLADIEQGLAAARAMETLSYVAGEQNLEEYNQAIEQLELESIEKRKALYSEGTTEFSKLQEEYLLKKKAIEDKEVIRSREALQQVLDTESKALKQIYINGLIDTETYKQELFEMEVSHLDRQAKSYEKGSNERIRLEKQKEDILLNDKLKKREDFEKQKENLYRQYSQKSADELKNLELTALEALHNEKLLSEEEFLKAQKELQKKYQEDNPTFLETEAGQAMLEKTRFALSSMETIMSSFNSYMQASADAEIAKIDRKYEAEIRAAGNNQFQLRKIEEKKQQEINKVNAKYADKALKFQMAMAISQAIQGSINAYTSTNAIPIIGPAMAPFAAAIALAAGMMNVASIKKQHAAAKQGFYEGGYTGSGRWDEEKGIVHSDEFVANRYAVRNPHVRPVLDIINRAQKNNSIGSLTSADFVQHLGGVAAASPVVNAPYSPVGANDEVSIAVLGEVVESIKLLNQRLNEPFVTVNTVDGEHGIKQALDKYNQQEKNKSR